VVPGLILWQSWRTSEICWVRRGSGWVVGASAGVGVGGGLERVKQELTGSVGPGRGSEGLAGGFFGGGREGGEESVVGEEAEVGGGVVGGGEGGEVGAVIEGRAAAGEGEVFYDGFVVGGALEGGEDLEGGVQACGGGVAVQLGGCGLGVEGLGDDDEVGG